MRERLAGGMELLHRGENLSRELRSRGAVERYVGARSAVNRKDREAVPDLLRAVFTYGDVAAIEALGAIGDPAGLEPLKVLLEYHTKDRVVDAIRRALGNSDTVEEGATWTSPSSSKATAGWHAGLETGRTDDWKARLNAVRQLQANNTEQDQQLLAQLRNDPDIIVRGCARWAI